MKNSCQNIYDVYCPLLYSIALQLCPTTHEAERILTLTFKKVHRKNLTWEEGQPLCFPLIKLIILTVNEHLQPGETLQNFKIKQFEKTPILHELLIRQISIEHYCIQNDISRSQVLLDIREEFLLVRNLAKISLMDRANEMEVRAS